MRTLLSLGALFRRALTRQDVTRAQASQQSEDARVELLRTSYVELLDATKHQDDKVGRLLAATAFLTAASLALANLVAGRALPRRFMIHGELLPPLALLALATFLLSVVFSVIMLTYSIATPLTIPAFTGPSQRTTGKEPSQIFFLEIAGVSLAEWQDKWSEGEHASPRI